MAHDYSDHEETASPDQLATLHQLAGQLDLVDLEIEQLEEQLKEAGKRAQQLRDNDLPELMLAIGMKEFTTTGGVRFKLREEVRASFFAKDPLKREPAFEWLKANGHDGLIKNTVTASFGKGQEKFADAFMEFVKEFDGPKNIAQKKDINHQTMLAFLRERLREGEAVPLEKFGAFVQKFVKIERP